MTQAQQNIEILPPGVVAPAVKRGRPTVYPWNQLAEVGCSFFVPGGTREQMWSNFSRIRKAKALKYMRFRAVPEERHGTSGVRVQRIK